MDKNKIGKCEQCERNNMEISLINEEWLCEHCFDYYVETYLENFGYND